MERTYLARSCPQRAPSNADGRRAIFRHNSWVPRHFGAPSPCRPAGENPATCNADRRPVMTLPSSSRYRRVGFGGTVADWLGLLVLLALCFT